jgi:uncharacterized membrane protein YfcA
MGSWTTITEICGVFALAGLVKGGVGFGLPTVAIGLLGLVMTPAQAAALLVVPSLVTNTWQAVAGGALVRLSLRLWPMLAGIFAGTWIGGGVITGGNAATVTGALGLALIAYAIFGLSKLQVTVPASAEWWLGPLTGIATGLVAGATGIFTLPAIPYLQAIGLEKDDLVQALGLSFTVSTLALAVVLMDGGVLRWSDTGFMGVSLVALIAALLGMGLGQLVRARVPAERFRLVFFVGLLLLGSHLALRAV